MNYFPIYMKMTNKRVVLIGNDDDIIAKARLVMKSSALIEIYADQPCEALSSFIESQPVRHFARAFTADDINVKEARAIAFAYLDDEDEAIETLLSQHHIPFCVIDNLAASQFTTAALVDRAPLTIAIGTEGTAPILARKIKADLEARLPQSLGVIAKIAGGLRHFVHQQIKPQQRRDFWRAYFDKTDYQPASIEEQATDFAHQLVSEFQKDKQIDKQNSVWFVGAGPGDPELLTLKARRVLHNADVILHDRLVDPRILELCRREAEIIEVGKKAFAASWKQIDINQLLVSKAQNGGQVVRLKSGDSGVFGRLDEEIDALDKAGISFEIVPGLTTANVAAAQMGISLTKRGRNRVFQFLTAHDVKGYAEHNWRDMARSLNEGEMASAIYMGVRSAPYLSGRLLMHGASPQTEVTVAEHVSRDNERWLSTTLSNLAADMTSAQITGPAVIFLGLSPHQSRLEASAIISEQGAIHETA